jgi:integrase
MSTVQFTEQRRKLPTGIVERHSADCPARDGGRCTAGRRDGCARRYEAWVYDVRSRRKLRKSFPTLAAARSWRGDALADVKAGRAAPPTGLLLRDAMEEWLAGIESGAIAPKGGRVYKPSSARSYREKYEKYIRPELGHFKLSELRREDVQAMVDRLGVRGVSPGTARKILTPLKAFYRHRITRHRHPFNPTTMVETGPSGGRRTRAADAVEAAELIAALPPEDRALWATAAYGGLRLGELRALRWSDISFANGEIHVHRGWDAKEGEIEPKSRKGTRDVPILALLRDLLSEQRARTGRDGEDFVFGQTASTTFTPSNIRKRARKAWAAANEERERDGRPPLVPIGLHEMRRTFVSLLADNGIPLHEVGDYVGHSTVYMTDAYRSQFEKRAAETARAMDEYLARADTDSRRAQVEASA